MTSTDPSRIRARDAGLASVRRGTAWCAALAVVASGAAAGALGAALPGRATTAKAQPSTRAGTSTSSSGTATTTTGATGSSGATGTTGSSTAPSVQAPVASSSPS